MRIFSGTGMRPIQDLTSASSSSSLLFHLIHRHYLKARGLVIGVFENGQAAENFSALQYLAAHGADHVLQSQTIRVGVITLRAREFAEADGHHLKEAALDFAREIGMPFHPPDQNHAVGR